MKDVLSKLLIHVGYHKTATTWFQNELFNANSDLFIPLARNNDPKYLANFFVLNEEGNLLSPFQLNKSRILKELDIILKEIKIEGRIPIISDERLSGNPHCSGFDSKIIANRLKNCFPNAKIFLVIREQKDMILSTYSQYLKAGGTDTLKMYLTRKYDGRRPGFSFEHIRYVDFIAYYHRLYSPENVLVLPYELFKTDPQDFFRRLGEFTSADITIQDISLQRVHNRSRPDFVRTKLPFLNLFVLNSSLNSFSPIFIPRSIKLVRGINKFLNWVIKERHSNLYKNQTQLIDSIIKNRFKDSNRHLSTLIQMDLSKYGYHG